jgi:hypothetical protein
MQNIFNPGVPLLTPHFFARSLLKISFWITAQKGKVTNVRGLTHTHHTPIGRDVTPKAQALIGPQRLLPLSHTFSNICI